MQAGQVEPFRTIRFMIGVRLAANTQKHAVSMSSCRYVWPPYVILHLTGELSS